MVSSPAVLAAAIAGLGLGLSLIVAIGAQNAFVLRQGLLGSHVRLVVTICALSDVVLIAAGILGAGAILAHAGWLLTTIRLAGAGFLLAYAILAARRAWRPAGLAAETGGMGKGRISTKTATATTCLGLTWLNPHVYLDTVVLLGAIANAHHEQRWSFGLGAALASIAWFTTLGYGARFLRPVFARPLAWRILDAVIAVIMTTLALSLAAPLL